jgi:PAS domain S-box-containing protein
MHRLSPSAREAFSLLFDAAPDAMVLVDGAGTIVMVNVHAHRLFGFERGELAGRPIEILVPERYRPSHLGHRAGYFHSPSVRPMGAGLELYGLRKDGSEFPVEISLSPVRTDAGFMAISAIRDISERKRADEERVALAREQAARAEAEKAERRAVFLGEAGALLASSLDYRATLTRLTRLAVPRLADLCAVDMVEASTIRRLAVTHVDPAKESLALEHRQHHGYRPDAPSGVAEVLRTGRPALVRRVTDEHLVHASQSPEQLEALRSLGLTSWLIVPLQSRGRVQGAITFVMADSGRQYADADVALAQDLAYRASIAIENAQLYDEAQAANRAKDEFLAVLSHELRTPLNAIYGWARMLASETLSGDDEQRALAVIERNARAQAQLIDDLLDVSRIVTGKMRLTTQPVDPATVVSQALDGIRPTADARQIRLHAALDPQVGALLGDPDRLQQVVWNLLTNAVKFTPRGGTVRVEVRRADSRVRIVVADDGEGIEPHVLPHVFERFTQADSSTTRVRGGLGIGLSLVRHLVELHGGAVTAHSEGPGKGATFTVDLPVPAITPEAIVRRPAAVAAPRSGTSASAVTGLTVLVVDDDPDSLELLRTILTAAGAHVEPAGSADTALEILMRKPIDVVVADIEMPGEDGYSLIRKIRATRGSALPAIALTAYGRLEDRGRALTAGFTLHMTKPADPTELITAVGRLARAPGAA